MSLPICPSCHSPSGGIAGSKPCEACGFAHPGTNVVISYTCYQVEATVIEQTRYGEKPGRGWLAVRQNNGTGEYNDYTDRPENERPEYLAAQEFVSAPGDPVKPTPLEAMMDMTRGLRY